MNPMNAQPAKTALAAAQPAADPSEASDLDTPAERRKRKVRDAIIEAAEDVFAVEGEAGLSMRRLADRIDYSPAAIYKYFASKDELLAEIREQFFERLIARLADAKKDQASDADRFRAGLRAYIQTGLENPNHYRMAFSNLNGPPPAEGTRCYEAATSFTAGVEALVANGTFRPVDAQLASKCLWASMHGLTNLMCSIPEFPQGMDAASACISRDGLIDCHVELLYRGLAAQG